MIFRLAANAAVHTAGGIMMGVTGVFAACTLAQVAKKAAENAPGRPNMPSMPPTPYTPPRASGTADNTGPSEFSSPPD